MPSAKLHWLQPVHLEQWPVRPVESAELYYRLDLPVHWSHRPLVREGPEFVQHAYCGALPSEWCVIEYLAAVDPAADLRRWQESMLHLYGFPFPMLAEPYQTPPRLYEWAYAGQGRKYARQLGVDEIQLYQGLAVLPERPAELARLYTVLARRATQAWKIALAISSACLPGTPAEVVDANDHCRAGATYGSLQLLPVQSPANL